MFLLDVCLSVSVFTAHWLVRPVNMNNIIEMPNVVVSTFDKHVSEDSLDMTIKIFLKGGVARVMWPPKLCVHCKER